MNLQPRDNSVDLTEVANNLYPHLRDGFNATTVHESYREDENNSEKVITLEAGDKENEGEVHKQAKSKEVVREALLKHEDQVRWFLVRSTMALMLVAFLTYVLTRDIAVLGTTTLIGVAVTAVFRYYFTRREN